MTTNITMHSNNQVLIDAHTLKLLTSCAQAHIEDIESGLEEGLYSEGENQDLPSKRQSLDAAQQLLHKVEPQATKQGEATLIPIVSNYEFKTISDDDLCARCGHCDYQPGQESRCAKSWPGQQDEDGYVQECATFEATSGATPRVFTLAEIQNMADQAANKAVASIQEQLGQTDGGFAATYFSGGAWEVLTGILEGYIRAEIEQQQA